MPANSARIYQSTGAFFRRCETLRISSPLLVGIDVGTKYVGIALSDPLHVHARALGSLSRLASLHAQLPLLFNQDKTQWMFRGVKRVGAWVVGWPLDNQGSANGRSCQDVIRFLNESFETVIRADNEVLEDSAFPILLMDERRTSLAALKASPGRAQPSWQRQSSLIQGSQNKKNLGTDRDAESARLILTTYLQQRFNC